MQPVDLEATLTNLPELQRLHGLVERNDWHDDDPLQQSVRLCRWICSLPSSLALTVGKTEEALPPALLAGAVDAEQGQHTVQELLSFAALIHDVGKTETFQKQQDGRTRCPGHETASARITPALCQRFDFTLAEIVWITAVVGAHGQPYELFKALHDCPPEDWQEPMSWLPARHHTQFLPLLLLAWGTW